MTDANWAFVKDKCPKMCKKCKSGRNSDDKLMDLKRLMLNYLKNEVEVQEEEEERK